MKRTLILGLCFLMVIISSSSVFATLKETHYSEDGVISSFANITDQSEGEYLQSISLSLKDNMPAEKQIQAVCEAFLVIAKASVREPGKYDCSRLIANNRLNRNTVEYRLSEYEYQAALKQAMGWEILRDELVFSDFKVSIKGNSALAKLVETYTYFQTDGSNSDSYRRRMYIFELEREADRWLVTNVTTDDPWELEAGFEYDTIDVVAAVEALLLELQVKALTDPVESEQENTMEPMSTMYSWTYDVSKAIAYAENHFSFGNNNPTFGYNYVDGSPANCQNFASQCVWAGLGGSGTSTTALPAVSTQRVGNNVRNVWCRNQYTNYYADSYFNWTWDNVRGFFKLIETSSSSEEGPSGFTQYSGLAYSTPGSVLAVNWTSTASSASVLNHAMFVTAVTGSHGNQTSSSIKIAAHSSHTNSAYQVLSTYTSRPASAFARAAIWGGWYTVPQP